MEDMKVRGQLVSKMYFTVDDTREVCIDILDRMMAELNELGTPTRGCGKSSTILADYIKRTIFESYKRGLLDGSIEFISTTHALSEIEVAINSISMLGIDTID